jgi:hypothetical protein
MKTELFCIFADASAYSATMSFQEDGVNGRGTTLWKSDTVRFVFDYLNVGNSRSQSKTNAEVTPTDVYIYAAGVCRGFCALTHTFGCIVYTPEGIKSVRSIERAIPTAKVVKRAADDTLVLFCL